MLYDAQYYLESMLHCSGLQDRNYAEVTFVSCHSHNIIWYKLYLYMFRRGYQPPQAACPKTKEQQSWVFKDNLEAYNYKGFFPLLELMFNASQAFQTTEKPCRKPTVDCARCPHFLTVQLILTHHKKNNCSTSFFAVF